jgi:uncharacterized membrane protein
MEVVKKKRPPYVYFAIMVIGLALIGITIGLFKTEVVNESTDITPVERNELGD